ncbi:MAG: lpxD, partial [Paucimonas sp.]|nr:lpxD [Paucimonas sp.]
MGIRLQELVERLGGQLSGDGELEVLGIAPLDTAGPCDVSFLSSSRFRTQAAQTRAGALILSASDAEAVSGSYRGALLIVDNPYLYFARSAQVFFDLDFPRPVPGIHPSAVIASSARLGADVVIGPHVIIEANV